MIRCALVHISRNKRGQAIRQEQLIEADILSIGRAAECRIHLPDHRVSLHHASIRHSDDGRLYVEGENTPLSIDGTFEQSAELVTGMHFMVGPYQFIAEAIDGPDQLTLSYELVQPLTEAETAYANRAPMTLSETGLSKRKIAWGLAGLVAFAFLVLPIVYALSPSLQDALKDRLAFTPEEFWNAGNMSPGHRALTTQCNTCHQRPFHAVENQACESCHKHLPPHIPEPVLHAKVFNQVRCSECHLDHRGRSGLVRHDTQQCTTCHGDIKTRNPETQLSNIHDFSTDHPAFRLTLRTGPGPQDVKRVRQSEHTRLTEHSGLKFSHQTHLEKALIELTPGGKTRDIQCGDCHKPDDAGRGFAPMNMTMTCQQSRCHALEFDPPEPDRHVPHASVQTVLNTLREFYANKALNHTNNANMGAENARSIRARARAEAERNAIRLFTQAEEGTCLECHEITRDDNDRNIPWKVAPVHITDSWLPKARFPHNKHQTAQCTDCHDITHSNDSADVAIPDIRNCRQCHVGSKPAKTQVSSTCVTCHNFHGVTSQQSSRPANTGLE
ncbi:MAG: FHA domain-containing protein [Methylophilaceae bacterium]|nr:FHA domain-containing protein [Methylophilaceae bacterium]